MKCLGWVIEHSEAPYASPLVLVKKPDETWVTHLIEHKVELTETDPVKHKPYPIPYKMQEIIDKEIDEMLRMGD